MSYIDSQLLKFKSLIESAIVTDGSKGKESLIRSSSLINLIHDAVKKEFIDSGVRPQNIYPPFGETKPELKIAGFLKQKDQDICIVPSNISQHPEVINRGPLAFEGKTDPYGLEYTQNTLVVNVRSQMSSLTKNFDTLFERTFAEAQNLHMRCPSIVLGEVYLIPVHEYDDALVQQNLVGFKNEKTNIEKYINSFNMINKRQLGSREYAYERCALLIVDFNRQQPYLFNSSYELQQAGYISPSFPIEYANLNFRDFAKDLLSIYDSRFNLSNLMR